MDDPLPDSPTMVIEELLKPSGEPKIFTLPLADFKEVFRQVYKQRGDSAVDIVLNGNWALAQFSSLCNHRIRVVPDNIYRKLPRVLGLGLYLEEKDFEIAASVATFYGQRKYLTLRRFIGEELSGGGIRLLLIFTTSGAILTLLAQSAGAVEILKSANEVLIGVATIFFSIFMLFTASQNTSIIENPLLFRKGVTHRFVRVDKLVSWVAFLALCVAASNRVLVESQIVTNWGILPWTSALAITLMADSLLAVVHYYAERVRYSYESDQSRKLLDEVFEKRNTR